MKPIIPTIVLSLFTLFPISDNVSNITNVQINTKYSEYPSAIFKNKLVVVSSKKIGGLGNGIDKNTNEPYSELFCLDVDKSGGLEDPHLFSRTLNTKHNEGQVTFTRDQKTVYYTRSMRKNSNNYQLYKADLDIHSSNIWINEVKLTRNSYYSIEDPHVSSDGKQLYFSSNLPGSVGGYDIYVSDINHDGTLSIPRNLGETINTEHDEKFPFLSQDGNEFYFSSKGHDSRGGFDVFVSNIIEKEFTIPESIDNSINSSFDEVAFMLTENNVGYFSSNKPGGKGNFDIYSFQLKSKFNLEEVFVVNNEKK